MRSSKEYPAFSEFTVKPSSRPGPVEPTTMLLMHAVRPGTFRRTSLTIKEMKSTPEGTREQRVLQRQLHNAAHAHLAVAKHELDDIHKDLRRAKKHLRGDMRADRIAQLEEKKAQIVLKIVSYRAEVRSTEPELYPDKHPHHIL